MLHYSPLRYPGGKRRLAQAVMRILEQNHLSDIEYAEPFVGGGALGLGLLFQEYASTIHLNDFCRPVYAIWHTIINDTDWLCRRIQRVSVTMREWKRRRAVYDRRESADLRDLGFSALFLNRTNRSGIIGGGVIGGKEQAGYWALDARFNKQSLIDRILKIARYRDRINLYCMDGDDFTQKVVSQLPKNSFTFFDPPYIDIVRCLYLNELTADDHHRLAASISALHRPWIVTYDCPAIDLKLYQSFRRIVYKICYTANKKHRGEEVMFLSDSLKIHKVSTLLGDRMEIVPNRSRLKLKNQTEPR